MNTRLIGKSCYENTSNNCLESGRGTEYYSKFSEMTRETRALSRILGNAFHPVRKTSEYPAAVTPPPLFLFSIVLKSASRGLYRENSDVAASFVSENIDPGNASSDSSLSENAITSFCKRAHSHYLRHKSRYFSRDVRQLALIIVAGNRTYSWHTLVLL